MPLQEVLEQFIAKVETNSHDEAIADFYTEGASTQENQDQPRIGRDNHVAREKQILGRAKNVTSECLRPVFVNGDHVVIRWKFRFVWQDDTVTEMEELAYQHWKSDRIASEQFFYDPKQRTAK